MIPLINVSDLTESINEGVVTDAWAKPVESFGGYCLYVEVSGKEMVVSTYLSTQARHFKRADALLKEAGKIGLNEVRFIDLAQ